MNNCDSILIVLTGSLGDLVRGTSVACAIKRHSPETHVTWLVDSTWQQLVQNHPAIDEILVFDRTRPVQGALQLRKQLAVRSFDITLDMQRHFKSGMCSWLSGADRRIGFHRKNCKEGNFFFSTETIPVQDDRTSKLTHYFAFLDVIGVPRPDPVDFGFAEVGLGTAATLLEQSSAPRIGIVLSSSWKSKDWPLQGYQKLLHNIVQQTDFDCLLLGSKSDRERAQKLCLDLSSERVFDLTGKTSLLQLVDGIRSTAVCVGPDSGPGHLAAAVQVPYVSLFGPTPPERVAPYGNEQRVIRATVPCSPCSRKICPGLNTVCMRLISPDRVLQEVIGSVSGGSSEALSGA